MPAGLCVFGMTYRCGLAWPANPAPLDAAAVIDLAANSGLSWVEMPRAMLAAAGPPASLRAYAGERGIRFVVAGGLVGDDLLEDLRLAAELGAPTVRCTLSRVLCGDRREVEGGWDALLRTRIGQLERLVPEAERAGVAIAIENHQDADSDDLLRICRTFESGCLGVTLDCGNPLAVMEEPVEFARHIAPYLKHAHLKDYRIVPARAGFRLTRCALGEGAIPFPALFDLFDAQEWPVTRNIEMAALQARLIPWRDESWRQQYPARDWIAGAAVRFIAEHAGDGTAEWRTPVEQGARAEDVAAYEDQQYHASLDYLRGFFGSESGG